MGWDWKGRGDKGRGREGEGREREGDGRRREGEGGKGEGRGEDETQPLHAPLINISGYASRKLGTIGTLNFPTYHRTLIIMLHTAFCRESSSVNA